METKQDIINQLIEIRDYDISNFIPIQDQIVIIFQLVSGQKTIQEVLDLVSFITSIYNSCDEKIQEVNALDDNMISTFVIPTTFKK